MPPLPQNAPWVRAGVPALLLAPMEGVTDAPMRALLAERGGLSFCVAEFLRVSHMVPPARAFAAHVPELAHGARTPSGLPVQVQLLGGDPERLALSAARAVACGATAIDLNFGCPARTVNRHDGGAALLRFPARIRAIVAAVRQALPATVPVSAKLRLGWEDAGDIAANAEMAAAGGAAWLTIHGRTRAQGYRPPAYWRPIGSVRRALGLPVVANGDIWTVDDLRRCQDESGCEHFMIGRGALADPWLPQRLAAVLGLRAMAAPAVPGAGAVAAPAARDLRPAAAAASAVLAAGSVAASAVRGAGSVAAPATVATAAAWQPLLRRFVALAQQHGGRSRYMPGRLKQWLKTSHQRFPNPWYERIKRLEDTAAIVAALGERA